MEERKRGLEGRCFFLCRHHTLQYRSFDVDGKIIDVKGEWAEETISIAFNALGSNFAYQIVAPKTSSFVAMFESVSQELEGVLSFSVLSQLNEGLVATPTGHMFSLDLLGAGQESVLWLGGIDEAYRERMVWGKLESDSLNRGFPITSLEVCGMELLPPVGFYYIDVDTKLPGLLLPDQIFNTLIPLLPVNCEAGVCTLLGKGLRLPTLSFQSEDGDLFVISLDALVIPASRRLCLYSRSFGPIVFGTRCLRSLFVTFSGTALGFSSRLPAIQPSHVQCMTKLRCKGMQEISPQLNMCLDPPCDNYYFYQLDHSHKVCVFSETFHTLAVTLLALFVTVEFVLQELELCVGRKVMGAFPINM